MREIIPTVVPATFDDVIQAKNRYSGLAPAIHVDATDGVFAKNRTWLPLSGEKLPEALTVYYEVHLMIDNPLSIGVSFARAGARRIIGHIEAFNNAECAREAFDMWQKAGALEVGVAILFETPLEELAPYISLCDFVHMMTIETIGQQGSPFSEKALPRIASVHERYPDVVISVDGGAKTDNIQMLEKSGASRICVGSALAKAKDTAKEFARLATI